jgi:hypothetical protein
MVDQKQLENVEYVNRLGSVITNDARCTRGIKCGIAMAKGALNAKKIFCHQQIGLKLKDETQHIATFGV